MAEDPLSGLGRRSALGLTGAFISGLSMIGTMLIASRSLSGSDTGEFFIAISVFAIAQGMCSLALDTGLQYFLPTLQPRGARRLLRTTVSIVTVMGLICAFAFFVLAHPLSNLLSEDGGDATSILRATAIMLPFAGLYESVTGSLRACDRVFVAVTLDRIIRPVLQVAAMLVVALLDGGAVPAAYAWGLPNVAVAVVAVVLLFRPSSTRRLKGDRAEIPAREFWHYTAPKCVARISQAFTQRLDVLILAAVGSVEAAGIYGTVSRRMIAGVFVATAVQQVVQPKLRRLVVKGELSGVKTMYGAATTWLVIATWPAYLAMAIFSPLVLRLFGPHFVRGHIALVILCLTMLVASACGPVDVVLLMVGRSWISTLNVFAALVVNIVLNFALVPSLGMNGSALAWMVSILMTNLLPLAQLRPFGLHPGGKPLVTAAAVAAGVIGVPLLAARVYAGPHATVFLVVFAEALLAYLAALRWVRRTVLLDRFFGDLGRRRSAARSMPAHERTHDLTSVPPLTPGAP